MQTAAIVLVCTANQCRSPMAGALLRRSLRARGADATVMTAGLRAGGAPAPKAAQRVMARRGLSLDEHRSRRLEASTLARADLVVTMERRHVQEVAALHAEAWERTFTCTELVARAQRVGARRPGEDLRAWVQGLSLGRRPADLVGGGAHVDVPDPVGRSSRHFEAVAAQLEELMERLAELAFPGPSSVPPPRQILSAEAHSTRQRWFPWRTRTVRS